MAALTPEERRLLGLSDDATVDLIGEAPPASTDVGQGASRAQLALAGLVALFSEPVPHPEVALPTAIHRIGDISVRRSVVEPSAFLLSTRVADVSVVGPSASSGEREWVIDGRGERTVLVHIRGEQGDGVLRIRGGAIECFAVDDEATAREAAEFAATLEAPPSVPSPDVDALVARLETPAWLMSSARERAESSWGLWRCAAAGIVARLWSPPPGARRRGDVMAVLASPGGAPSERALAWYATVPDGARDAIVDSALREVERLLEVLPDLEGRAAAAPATAREEVRRWLHARDDLECVAFFVRTSARRNEVDQALATLDERAATHHSMYASFAPFRDDERLRAVSFTDPLAWWGNTALA